MLCTRFLQLMFAMKGTLELKMSRDFCTSLCVDIYFTPPEMVYYSSLAVPTFASTSIPHALALTFALFVRL